jgi:hypothetical protein
LYLLALQVRLERLQDGVALAGAHVHPHALLFHCASARRVKAEVDAVVVAAVD